MIKVLLSGSDGQLGQLVQQQFATMPQFNLLACNRAALDITNTAAVSQLFTAFQPAIVINCAAYTAVDQAERNSLQCHSVNASAVAQLAQLCRRFDSLFISISTDYVFDGSGRRPYIERDLTAPLNQYGLAKQQAERAAEQAIKYITLRTSWLFSELGANFVSRICQQAQSGDVTRVVQDQYGNPTPARALAQAIGQLAHQYVQDGQLRYGLYHFAGYPCCSWYQFAIAIYQLVAPQHLHKLQGIASPFPGALARRPAYSCLDMSLFQQQFSFKAPPWQAELAAVVKKLAE
ncbi:dTDP-4-dehydrorhamnose reductase [Rheinheimera muenzenbergensis]|uniref:dTDP-4-dehydrorhamnose reductase n=1 Tax=Rheinheimera muenzenbergensis TaxID=1193628 RepID=A0ABU8C1R4_9GAMM